MATVEQTEQHGICAHRSHGTQIPELLLGKQGTTTLFPSLSGTGGPGCFPPTPAEETLSAWGSAASILDSFSFSDDPHDLQVFSQPSLCDLNVFFFFSTAHCVPQHICRVQPLLKIFTASERWRAEDVKCWRRKEKKSAQRERGIPFTLYQCVYHLSFLCLSEDYIQIAQIKAERDKK